MARKSPLDDPEKAAFAWARYRRIMWFMLAITIGVVAVAIAFLYDGESERDSNVVEVHVNRLRRKLGRDTIQTRRGQGYLFVGHGAA